MVALFKICRQDRFRDLYAHALRTVASICCVEEGINQLDKVGQPLTPQTASSELVSVEIELVYIKHRQTELWWGNCSL